MPDVFTRKKRSDVMSRIRSRGNKDTELALAKLFRRERIKGWRRHVEVCVAAALPPGPVSKAGQQRRPAKPFRVHPDFVFPKPRLAVFVDGCFWHGCPKHGTKPRNNAAFWQGKFAANTTRDLLATQTLRRDGWRVLRIWEHELASKNRARLLARLKRFFAHRPDHGRIFSNDEARPARTHPAGV
jgi:DNA mismatch endonuclease (patch repair protein)